MLFGSPNLPTPASGTQVVSGAKNSIWFELFHKGEHDWQPCHGTDFSSLVRRLPRGSTLELRYQNNIFGNPENRILLRLEDTDCKQFDVSKLLECSCPGFTVASNIAVPRIEDPEFKTFPRCRGETILIDGQNTPSISSGKKPQAGFPATLILPCWTLHPDIPSVLTVLAETLGTFEFGVKLSPFALPLADSLLVSQAIRQLRPTLQSIHADPFQARRRFQYLDILEAWMRSTFGIQMSFWIATETPIPGLPERIADLLLGHSTGSQLAPTEGRACDLSLAIPESERIPDLLPAAETLTRLGYTGARRLRRKAATPGPCVLLGSSDSGAPVTVPRADLDRHMLVTGATGVGKSTLITQLIKQDAEAGIATVVIDPHGDLFEAARRTGKKNAIVADLSGRNGSFGLNLMESGASDPSASANFMANQLINVFRRILYRDQPESLGPMFESYFRNALILLLTSHPASSVKNTPGVLTELDRIFHDTSFRRICLDNCPDENIVRFWTGTALRAGGDAALENIAPYIVSKLTQFTGNPLIRPILSGEANPIEFGAALDAGQSIFINLAKGRVGTTDAALVGALVTIQIFNALLARCDRPKSQRPPVRIYMDEYQTYATDTLAQMLAESRKTGAGLVLASQDLTSFGGSEVPPSVAGAILSNVGNLLTFRTGPRDAHLLADWYAPTITAEDLMQLPDRVFAARVLDGGMPRAPQLSRTMEESTEA